MDQADGAAGSSTPLERAGKPMSGAQTLERGLELLEMATQEPMSAADLVRRSGLGRGIVYRMVSVLTAQGYLALSGDGRLRGGNKLLHLGHLATAYNDIVPVAAPHVEALAGMTGLTAFLAKRDGDYSVHLMRAAGTERLAVTTQPGTRRFLPETGLGKALLLDEDADTWSRLFELAGEQYRTPDWIARMAESVEAGLALQFGPAPDLINSVSAPVRDASGRIIAAVNVAAAAQYLDRDRMREVSPAVLDTAGRISAELGAVERSVRPKRSAANGSAGAT